MHTAPPPPASSQLPPHATVPRSARAYMPWPYLIPGAFANFWGLGLVVMPEACFFLHGACFSCLSGCFERKARARCRRG